jgi:RimJ/RimL family protein N-acetyltransferase
MILLDEIQLDMVKNDIDKKELEKIKNKKEVLQFLSEKNLYWDKMPDAIDLIAKSAAGEVVGGASIYNIKWFNRTAYITIFVDVDKQGRGFGKKILAKTLEHAFKVMNLHRLTAEIYEYNESSIRLFESFGFVKEGIMRKAKYINGKYWDIIIYGLLKDEYVDE